MLSHRLLVALLLAAATQAHAGVTTEGNFRIEYAGNKLGPHTDLDAAVMSWMTNNNIHDAQLAVRRAGQLYFSHAYTMGST
ncbi:MAG: hypothetical protein WDN04_04840 [Rhodospirillales bacterium]